MKIVIVGIVASGKTTLAKNLSKENKIPTYEMDTIVHDDINNIKRTPSEQKELIKKINKENKDWIIEGTLRKNMDFLLAMADKVIYLDIPLKVRKRRIVTRYIKQKLKLEKSSYKPTIEMLRLMFKWTNDFESEKEEVYKRLNKYHHKLIILDTKEKISNYKLTK